MFVLVERPKDGSFLWGRGEWGVVRVCGVYEKNSRKDMVHCHN